MCSCLRRPSARARPPIPPPTMATLMVFDLGDSVVGFWVTEVVGESVSIVLEVEDSVVVVVEVEAIWLLNVVCVCNIKVGHRRV